MVVPPESTNYTMKLSIIIPVYNEKRTIVSLSGSGGAAKVFGEN